jgi:hypothetical protein
MADKLRGGSTVGGNIIWHAGNDGTGSGLDADLLDGQSSAYYATATSVTALAAKDPVLTLAGDVTGTATFTNLGNATLTAVVADDSHTHSNYLLNNSNDEFVGQLTVDNTGKLASTYTWTGSAIQTTSIEIIDANSNDETVCPTLFMHNYGDGGVKFRMGNTGDKTLYLSSGQGSDAGSPTDNNAGTYFNAVKLNGNIMWHAGNDGSGSGLDADLLDGQHASAFAPASHTHSYLPLSGGTLTGVLAANAGISQDGHVILNGSDTWLRTLGDTGWYNDTYAGGWYMTDTTYVRTYNNKSIYTGGTLVEASDARLKENIKPITDALSKVTSLQGVHYNKIETPELEEIGFIAQEVEKVVPEIVTTDDTEEGMKAVSYARTVALLVEAMKEQQAQIEELKLRLKEGGL